MEVTAERRWAGKAGPLRILGAAAPYPADPAHQAQFDGNTTQQSRSEQYDTSA